MIQILRTAKNVITGKPILTIFDVTKLCNQRCPMCNIWKEKSNDMPVSEIIAYAEKLKKFGIGYVFIQGGEPTIRKDIFQIVDAFISRGIKPTLITNGILLDAAFADKIAGRKCNLAISIDSLDPGLYKKTRGADTLDKVVANIKNISGIKQRKGNWSITTTISKLSTLGDIKNLQKFAKENGFMYAIRPYVFVKGTAGRADDELAYTYDDIAEIYDYMIKQASKDNYLASIVYKKHVEYIQGKPMKPCDAMKRSFLLKETGKIAPCIEYPDIELKLEGFCTYKKQQKEYKHIFRQCNRDTPCFYNDAREIGILLRSIPRLILASPVIIRQMIKYGNFF